MKKHNINDERVRLCRLRRLLQNVFLAIVFHQNSSNSTHWFRTIELIQTEFLNKQIELKAKFINALDGQYNLFEKSSRVLKDTDKNSSVPEKEL